MTPAEFCVALLELGAVRFNLETPYTWASGWRSPVYCDNRLTLSSPAFRKRIARALAENFQTRFPLAEAVVGVATAGIPHGLLVAEALGLPFLYVRSKPKAHGLGNQVEGKVEPGQRVGVVEDLVSTGGSSLGAVTALRAAGLEVVGLGCLFTYGFALAEEAFKAAEVPWFSLADFPQLVHVAEEMGVLPPGVALTLAQWRQNPAEWQPAAG